MDAGCVADAAGGREADKLLCSRDRKERWGALKIWRFSAGISCSSSISLARSASRDRESCLVNVEGVGGCLCSSIIAKAGSELERYWSCIYPPNPGVLVLQLKSSAASHALPVCNGLHYARCVSPQSKFISAL